MVRYKSRSSPEESQSLALGLGIGGPGASTVDAGSPDVRGLEQEEHICWARVSVTAHWESQVS